MAEITEKVQFQIFLERKQKELFQSAYPKCVSECSGLDKNHEKLVYEKEELVCAQNCL